LSSLSYLSDWPTDIIRIVADYMSIQLWIAFEEYAAQEPTVRVLNLTSLRNEMKNNTFKYSSNSSSNDNQQPLLREGVSSTSLNLAENDGIMAATSEWQRWTFKRSIRSLPTYAIIDNLLVS
jgi:hypothetical protein